VSQEPVQSPPRSGTAGPAAQDAQNDVLWCRVTGPDPQSLRDFVETSGADSGCRPVARRTERGLIAWLELTQAALDAARASRAGSLVEIEVLENLTQTQAARQAEVGAGDRYAQRGAVPRGLGSARPDQQPRPEEHGT
jgi:hypothetical protein